MFYHHSWGGNHFMFGGAVNGGKVLGQFPDDFEQGDAAGLALSRGRMIPTTPWDAMWLGVAEWFGVPLGSPEMEKVLPMHSNFPASSLYDASELFLPPSPTQAPTPPPTFASKASPTGTEPNVQSAPLFG